MFARKPGELVSEATPAPETVEAPPAKVEVRDARCMQPSTFASRRAKTAAPAREPRLVSLGWHERSVTVNTKGDTRVVDVELLFDRDNTVNRYYRMRGGRPEPMFETGPSTDVATVLPPMRADVRPPGAFPDALPEPPPRPAE